MGSTLSVYQNTPSSLRLVFGRFTPHLAVLFHNHDNRTSSGYPIKCHPDAGCNVLFTISPANRHAQRILCSSRGHLPPDNPKTFLIRSYPTLTVYRLIAALRLGTTHSWSHHPANSTYSIQSFDLFVKIKISKLAKLSRPETYDLILQPPVLQAHAPIARHANHPSNRGSTQIGPLSRHSTHWPAHEIK